jgi:hypothetical protein
MTSQSKGMVLFSLINISRVGSKVPSSLKTTTRDSWLLIPHKENSHTKINQPAVTAKILSQVGIQLCVASVALQSWQRDFHGLHERLTSLVQHSGHIQTQIVLEICQRFKKIFHLHYGTVYK